MQAGWARLITWAIAAQSAAVAGRTEAPAAIVSDLHTVSIHVANARTYDAVFDLLGEGLGWPLLYGRKLGNSPPRGRNYASFRVGNANLEICGPYPEEFAPGDGEARLHGLTFQPALSAEDSVRLLDAAGIGRRAPFSVPPSGEKRLTFVVVDDDAVTGPRLSVSLMDAHDRPAQDEEHRSAERALDGSGGGPLGAVRIRAVEVTQPAPLTKWRRLLASPAGEGRVPAVRVVDGESRRVAAVVIEVRSLERAESHLRGKQLLGERGDGRVALGDKAVRGVNLVFVAAGR
jgi:hypothetical protein